MAKVVHKSFPVFKSVDVSNVDRENGIIKNVVIIESGIDKYGDNFDETFLRSMELQGNSQPMGVKSRFGHPSMSKEALGSYLGRFKNFNVGDVDGKQVLLADLYLDKTAKASPTNGNMYDYVLDMASSNDDMFGNSVVFMADKEEIKTEKDVDGNEVRVPYVRLKTFMASDIVDSPAATTSLFKDYNEGNFAAKATEFFDENPEFVTLLKSHPEKVKEFINKYEIFKEMAEEKSFLVKLKELISGTENNNTPETQTETPVAESETLKELNDLKEQHKSLTDEIVTLKSERDNLLNENAEIKSTAADLVAEVESKEADILQVKNILKAHKNTVVIPAENKTFAVPADEAAASNPAAELSKDDKKAKLRELRDTVKA